MNVVPVKLARNNLKELVDFVRFQHGKVLLTRRGRAVAELVPVQKEQFFPTKRPSKSATAEPQQDSRV